MPDSSVNEIMKGRPLPYYCVNCGKPVSLKNRHWVQECNCDLRVKGVRTGAAPTSQAE